MLINPGSSSPSCSAAAAWPSPRLACCCCWCCRGGERRGTTLEDIRWGTPARPLCWLSGGFQDMYAETGLLFQHLQGYYLQELHHHRHPLEEELFCRLQSSDGHLLPPDGTTSNLVQTTAVSDYDLGGEGDLFKAPEPIMEEPVMELDYISAAMSMMCNGDNAICTEAFKVAGADPIQNDQLFVEDLYKCKNDPWTEPTVEDVYSDLLDVKLHSLQIEGENMVQNDNYVVGEPARKCVTSGCLESMDQISGGFVRPAEFFDFQGMDLGDVLAIRRAYSDGDIQAVANGHMNHFNGSTVHLPFERLSTIGEERRQKLYRYRKKRTKRNFGRKIKYACRKALADSQPRVRGRFAKTEECDPAKPSK